MNLNSPFFALILMLFSPQFGRPHDLPASSPRKSINYGPDHASHSIKSLIYLNHLTTNNNCFNPQSILTRFNANPIHTKATLLNNPNLSLKSFGVKLATRYLHHLHPSTQLSFQLTLAHISKHTNVLHAYFVQTVPSDNHPQSPHIRVHNAVANLNVDIDPKSPEFGHILSHSDSFHPITQRPPKAPASLFLSSFQDQQSSCCHWLKKQFKTVLESVLANPESDQQVFGLLPAQLAKSSGESAKKHLSDFSEEELQLVAKCKMSTHIKKPMESKIVDPQIALISFLTLAADHETKNLVCSQSLDNLVQLKNVVRKSPPSFQITWPLHPMSNGANQFLFLFFL